MPQFLRFASKNTVLPLTEESVMTSGEIYAELRKEGNPLDDIDLINRRNCHIRQYDIDNTQ